MFEFLKRKKKADAAGAPKPSPSTPIKQSLLSLEQRLMFDAAAAATAVEVKSEQVAQEQAEAAVSTEASHETTGAETGESQDVLSALASYMPTESRTEVVFVDPTVPNYQELLAGMSPNTEVIMLDAGKDGVQQIADSLAGRTGVDAIHLISHGNAGELQLGTSHLTQESMTDRYASELAVIKESLSEQADLLIYGCNFAEGEQGGRAATTLADLTGTDVEASVDLTGSAGKGGDWDLEFKVGQIETSLAVGQVAQENWADILAVHAVAVADINNAPTDLSLLANIVAENAANGTTVGTVTGTDPDSGDAKTYSLTDTAGGRFAINSSTGALTVADGSLLNYEAASSHNVTVRVTDSGGLTYDEAFTINLTNVNEAPTVTSNGGGAMASVTVAENQTAVTTVTASDVDAGTTLTYRITGGADAGRFTIDRGTGALRFATAPNFERATDAGRNNVYEVTVRVSDGRGGTDTQRISVRVTDVNEAPTITSNRGGDVAAVTIRENSTAVTTVRATDPDRGNTVSYSVAGGADAAKFSINSRTGALRFISAPNFERPTDTGGNNVYQVVVQASDGRGGVDFQTINVSVTDRNDIPHELDFTGGTVAEGAPRGTLVGTAIVSDEDRVDTHTFSLVDDAGGRFAIHPRTGYITVADGALLDGSNASSHTISVRVTDAGRASRTEAFTINLTNVNETPTNILLSGNTVAENAAPGLVVGQASTVDPDAGDTHTYSLTNDASGRFSIDSHTGEITVANGALLDHEQTSSHTIAVRSTDSGGLMRDQTFTITVSNVNEAPTVLNLSGTTVAENAVNGMVVGTAAVIDPDAGDTHTYSLTNDAGGRFAVNASTGQITVADSALVNYGSTSNFNIAVRVTDSGGQIHEQTFTISRTAGNLPGSLAPIALPSMGVHEGAGSSSPDPSSGETGGGSRPPEDLRRSQSIITETPFLVEALSPERAPTRSAPIESLDDLLENAGGEEFLEHSSSRSGESGRAQGQTWLDPARIGEGGPPDAKESELRPVQADASAKTDVAMTVGIAGVVLQGGLLPKEKLTALGSRLRGNVPSPISGHDVGADGPRPDGEESLPQDGSESDKARSS